MQVRTTLPVNVAGGGVKNLATAGKHRLLQSQQLGVDDAKRPRIDNEKPQRVGTKLMAKSKAMQQMGDSTDWENELDKQSQRLAVDVDEDDDVKGNTDAVEENATTYVSDDDDIIQYEGGEYFLR